MAAKHNTPQDIFNIAGLILSAITLLIIFSRYSVAGTSETNLLLLAGRLVLRRRARRGNSA